MTKRVGQTPFYELLPDSIRDDATITASAASLDPSRRSLVLGIPNVLLWARLDPAPGYLSPPLQRLVDLGGGLKPLSEAELELLAYQLHVDFRETATTREQLAAMVRNAIPWHRIKGTPAGLKAALALFGYGVASASPPGTAASRAAGAPQGPRSLQATAHPAQDVRGGGIIIEEDGVGDYWATYQLGLPQIATPEEVRRIVTICNEMAPVRCRLWRVYTDVFDRRPIVVGDGPKLGDGWLTFYSGTPVPGPDGSEDDVLVSFGVRNAFQSEPYSPGDMCGSFGATTWYGFLAPYLDRFIVGRSRLSDVYPRNHGFAMGSLFSILWADRATTGRRWRGYWDARRWLDYTGFDRKLPQWRMERRAASRAQLVPGWGEVVSDCNARLGATFAVVIDNPGRLGGFALSNHDSQRRELRLHEMFIHSAAAITPPVDPGVPSTAGGSRLSVTSAVPDPTRCPQARRDEAALRMKARDAPAPRDAAHSLSPLLSHALAPDPAPPAAVVGYRAPLWLGAWTEPGRTWRTEKEIVRR